MSGSPPEVAFEISRPASIPIPVETQAETSTSGLELLDSSTAVIENSGSPLSTPLDYSTIPKALQGAGVHAEAPPAIDSEAAELLGRYQTGVAVWMDLFDHRMFYQRDVVRRAFTSRLLLYAVCAFAAKQLSTVRSSEVWGPVAARYYGEALPLLMRVLTDPAAHKEDALTAIIILSSYEILAAPGVEHKRHLYGAFTLIKTYSINAGSKALERASFWIYVRQDVVMALINECPLLLSPMNWNVSFSEHEVEEDALGNQILWLLGQTINLVFHKPGANAKRSNREIHIRISEQLNAWFEGLSLSFTGARCGMMLPQGFVRVCFSGAAAGIQHIHTLSRSFICLGLREQLPPC